MKKQILSLSALIALFSFSTNQASAQFTPIGNVAQGNPGIDEIKFTPSSSIRTIRGESEDYLEIYSKDNGNDGPALFLYSNTTSAPWGSPGRITMWTSDGNSDNNTDVGFEILHNNGASLMTSLFTLDKDGDITLKNNNTTYNAIKGNSNTYGSVLFANTGWNDGCGIMLNGNGNTNGHGEISFVAGAGVNSDNAFTFWTDAFNNDVMTIKKDGKVRIGSASLITSSNDYKLFVETGIITEKLKVANSNDPLNWADFVFDDEYQLSPLYDVEQFIKTNKHLPEIPTAEEVAKNGIDVAEMDAKLLQKIEELTLYVIQQQKEIDDLKNKLNK